MGSAYNFQIPLTFEHRILFGRGFFERQNSDLIDLMQTGAAVRRVLVFLDAGVSEAWPELVSKISTYFDDRDAFEFCEVVVFPGGELAKADDSMLQKVWSSIENSKIDRHSYVIAIGGGAFLDIIGFAAATAHRGVRLIRFPTSTLAQDDSGVGVKNGINGFGKKNWIGSFSVPYAVINDFEFLELQDRKPARDGLIEAIKVALVKDRDFFVWIEGKVDQLFELQQDVLEELVEHSAILHAKHIAEGGDPFEAGSSRPLDFGHWAAHKLEQMTEYQVSHAEAVAVGLSLDVVYSSLKVGLDEDLMLRILRILDRLDMMTWHSDLERLNEEGEPLLLQGLEEFREHLGGQLTVLFLEGIGEPVELHAIDNSCVLRSLEFLKSRKASQLETAT